MLGRRFVRLYIFLVTLCCVTTSLFFAGRAQWGVGDGTNRALVALLPTSTAGVRLKPQASSPRSVPRRRSFNVPTSRLCKYPCAVLRKWAKKSRSVLGGSIANDTPSPPLAFVHIPKTGGTAVERAFGIAASCHVTASAMSLCDDDGGRRGERERPYGSALSFAVLRHPIDRAVSMFDFVRRRPEDGGPSGAERHGWAREVDFDGFVREIPGRWDYFYAPMSHFVLDKAGGLLVKEVLCFDDLDAGWDRLLTLVPEWEPSSSAKSFKRWRSSGNHTVTAISAITLKRLHEYYKDDFDLWSRHCGGRESLLFFSGKTATSS